MTDDRPEDERDEAALDPRAEAEVRRLLGDAREEGPPPPEVVARLDATLAELRASAGGEGSDAGRRDTAVVPLRRRRVRRALIGAAAAAAAVAIGVPVTMSVTQSTGSDGSGAAVTGDRAPEEAPGADREESGRANGGADPSNAPEALAGSEGAPRGLLPSPTAGQRAPGAAPADEAAPAGGELLLSQADFEDQVTALIARGGLGPVPARSCGAPERGRRIATRYEDDLGTLLLASTGDAVRARLYLCGEPGVARRLSVPLG